MKRKPTIFVRMTQALCVAFLAAASFCGGSTRAQEQLPPGEQPAPCLPVEIPQLAPWPLMEHSQPDFPEPGADGSKSRLPDEAIGIQPIPDRPPLVYERNDFFLSPGFLSLGIELPTGAVVRPSLWVFGTNRFGFQYFDTHQGTNATEMVNRLDLFTQLNLNGTERILYKVRPFDQEVNNQRRYTSYDFTDGQALDGMNFYVESLFYEGNLAEVFPCLDPYSTKALDWGYSVGRQPLVTQDGILINTNEIDMVALTRNTISGHGILNMRVTALYAWDRIHRNQDLTRYIYDPKAQMFGILSETDLKVSTVNLNLAYVDSNRTGNAFYFEARAAQRINCLDRTFNTTVHALTSFPTDGETLETGRGVLLFDQISLTPHGTDDVLYVVGFWAIDSFTSVTRNVEVGGPLAPEAGILFASPAFGQYGSPLSNLANNVVGGSIGYQFLLDDLRKQLIFELGGRKDTDQPRDGAIGLGARYLQAYGQHWILLLDSFITKQENIGAWGAGSRFEILAKF